MSRYDDIYDYAFGSHGLVTATEAHALGVSDRVLSRLTATGKLERVGHGVYRVRHHVPDKTDQYAVAVACAGDGARLMGQSVLALLDLCPTDPRRIRVGVTRRVRRRLPPHVELDRVRDDEAITLYEGIPSQPVALAIAAARGHVMDARLLQAANEAMRRGLLLASEYDDVLGWLDGSS